MVPDRRMMRAGLFNANAPGRRRPYLQEHGLDEEAKHKHVGKNNGDRDGDERRAAPHALHREEHEPQVVDHEAAHDGVLLQRVQEVVLERHVRDVEHKEEGDDAQSAGQLKLRAGRAQENGDQHDGNFPAHDHDLPEVVVLLHACGAAPAAGAPSRGRISVQYQFTRFIHTLHSIHVQQMYNYNMIILYSVRMYMGVIRSICNASE